MFRRGMWGCVLRHRDIGDLRFQSYVMGEDVLFMLEFFWRTKTWVLAPAPVYRYRVRENSAVMRAPCFNVVQSEIHVGREIVSLFERNRGQWQMEFMKDFWQWNRDFVWFTFKYMFFRLPYNERRLLIRDWAALQLAQQRIISDTLYRRTVAKILYMVPSNFLLFVLVSGFLKIKLNSYKLYGRVRKMILK